MAFLTIAMLLAAQDAPAPRACTPPPRGQTSWVTNDDYPAPAMRARQEGIVEFTLDVGVDGCVTACRINSSSGYLILDNTTCSLLTRRARFSPAQDASGKPIAATWSSQFQWVLPPEYPLMPEPWTAHAMASYSEDGRLLSCIPTGDANQTYLARFCTFASRISPAHLAILRKGRTGPFTVLMEGAGRFDGQSAVPVAHQGELVGKVTIDFGIDARGDISTCNARDETPAELAGKFRGGCGLLMETYIPPRDAAGKAMPSRGSIAIVYTMLPPPVAPKPASGDE